MTVRRVVLYTTTTAAIAYILACAVILHAADCRDHHAGWYDPVDRRLAWHGFPRCLP